MLAAYASRANPDSPLDALAVGEIEPSRVPEDWIRVEVRAASLNHHDIWSLRGIGLSEEHLPMVLGCDAAGVDPQGNEVVVHAVIGDPDWGGEETADPTRTLLSELHSGTLAEFVHVPRRNLVPKPSSLSWAEAACLPTAYLTAYRMLFSKGRLEPGETVLVQGAAGGLVSAAILLASAAGLRVWATSRDEDKRAFALELGAERAFETGARLPQRVDAVIDSVGAATWEHSMKSLIPGGRLVVAGATSGAEPSAELFRLFFKEIQVLGSTMGSREELAKLLVFLDTTGRRPAIDRVLPLEQVGEGLSVMLAGEQRGKIVMTPPTAETSKEGR